MRTMLTATFCATSMLLAACTIADDAGDEAGVTEPDGELEQSEPADAAEPDDRIELTNECHNDEAGYRIRYPADWHSNDGEVTAACQIFDVEPPHVEPDTVMPLASSVIIIATDHAFDDIVELVDDDPAIDVEEVLETTMGGRDVVRVDGFATGEAYLDAGVEVHHTYVELGGGTLNIQANDLGEPDLDLRREVIAEMLATLEADTS